MLRRSHRAHRLLGVALLFVVAACSGLEAQELEAPGDLKVVRKGDFFRGRWSPVRGSAYYEVWVEKFGRWSFNKKNLATTPFTSSFELPVEDERARFRVRAVDSSGNPGAFSAEVRAVRAVETPDEEKSTSSSTYREGGKSTDTFDPKAPPPEPPTSLFALWTDKDTIKLVWSGPKNAVKYSVEEYRDGQWISIPLIEFPKKNNAVIKNHPTPGPYKFRVRSVGSNGRASKPSRSTTAKL